MLSIGGEWLFKVAYVDNCEDHHGEKNHKQTTRIMSGHDCRNRCVFSLRRNTVSDGAVVKSSGRLFQSLGLAVANDRSPTVTQSDKECKFAGRWRTKTGSRWHVTDADELFRQVPRCSTIDGLVDKVRQFKFDTLIAVTNQRNAGLRLKSEFFSHFHSLQCYSLRHEWATRTMTIWSSDISISK